MDFVSICLTGRLVKKPDLSYTDKGTALAKFTVASSIYDKTQPDNKRAQFTDCYMWGTQAEFVAKNTDKGIPITVVGDLIVSNYEDKISREKKRSYKVQASTAVFQFLSKEKKMEKEMNGVAGFEDDIPF